MYTTKTKLNGTKQYSSRERGPMILSCRKLREWSEITCRSKVWQSRRHCCCSYTVDRGRGDPRNSLGVILDCDEQNMYTIAVKSEIISSKYARNQFDLCPQKLLTYCYVNMECTVTLRQAATATTSGGQWFFDVIVQMVKKQCQTNRCK